MKIKNYLQENKITARVLARMVGCSDGAISLYSSGREPRPDIARRIIKATKGQVSWDDLYAEPDQAEA